MKDLIDQISSELDIESPVAERAVLVIMNILRKYAPEDKFELFLNAIPGANALMSSEKQTDPSSSSDQMSNPFLDLIGNDEANPLMELMTQMQTVGLDMDQAKVIGLDILEFAKSTAGVAVVRDVTDSIPGLSQFL